IIKNKGLKGILNNKVFLITSTLLGISIKTGRALTIIGTKVFLAIYNIKKGKEVYKLYLKFSYIKLIKLNITSYKSIYSYTIFFLEKLN
ncbi:hypothetical protein P171DRAFT_361669, partial [Karstenula rhodostoma CBS 690.94]